MAAPADTLALDQLLALHDACLMPSEQELVARMHASDVRALRHVVQNGLLQLVVHEALKIMTPAWDAHLHTQGAWVAFAGSLPLFDGLLHAVAGNVTPAEQAVLFQCSRIAQRWRTLEACELASPAEWRAWVDAM